MRGLIERIEDRGHIDKRLVDQIRKAWAGHVKRMPSVRWTGSGKGSGMFKPYSTYLGAMREWVRKLADDLVHSHGLSAHGDVVGYLRSIDDVFKDAFVSYQDCIEAPHSTPERRNGGAGYTEVDLECVAGVVRTAIDKADARMTHFVLPTIESEIERAGKAIELARTPREVSLGRAKLIFKDSPAIGPKYAGRAPTDSKKYIRSLEKARSLLKSKGLDYLWYGPMFIESEANTRGYGGGTQAVYRPGSDSVVIFRDPDTELARIVAHELGHRLWYRFMSSGDRKRFSAYFKQIPAVSRYGGSDDEEDFAEVFAWYVDGRKLTRDQLERFKAFTRVKGKRIRDDVHVRLDALISESLERHFGAGRGALVLD